MTGLIAIDESGDLGPHGTKYFAIAAIVVLRARNLKRAADLLPNDVEIKWHNATPQMRIDILTAMSEVRFRAVYTVVDKNNPDDHHPIYGKELYERTLRQVLSDAMSIAPCRDLNIWIDKSSFISLDRFREMVNEEAMNHSINPMKVHKVHSDQNKCIQLVDFIAGASRAKYEYADETINELMEKLSVARRH